MIKKGGLYIKRKITRELIIKRKLENELRSTQIALECVYSQFENVTDPDLIDACIYQINAIHKKYKYLLNLIKKYENNFL